MEWAVAKSQWSKHQILSANLPVEIAAEVKSLLKLKKEVAGATAYKVVKDIKLYGPKQGDAYEKALQLVLHDKPSQLAKT